MGAETRVEVAARVESLGTVRAFVENACRRAGADAESCFDLKLAVDEACTNIIEHGYAGRPDGTIAVSLRCDGRHAPGDHPGPRPELHARLRRPRRRRFGLERPAGRRSRLAFHPQLRGRGRLRAGSRRRKPTDSHEEEPEVTEIRIDVVARGPVEVVVIAGSVDGATAPSLVAAFRQRVGEGRIRIVGDFARRRLHLERGTARPAGDGEGGATARRRPPPRRRAAGRAPGPRPRRIHRHPQALRERRGGGGELSRNRRVTEPHPRRPGRRRHRIGLGEVRRGSGALQGAAGGSRIPIDMVVGCSGGALYAACIALGYDVPTAERKTRELWTKEITKKRNTRALLSAMLPRVFGFDERFGLVDDGIVMERLREGVRRGPDRRREDPPLPDGDRFLHGRAGRLLARERRRRGPRLDRDPLHLPALEDRRADLRRRLPVRPHAHRRRDQGRAPT